MTKTKMISEITKIHEISSNIINDIRNFDNEFYMDTIFKNKDFMKIATNVRGNGWKMKATKKEDVEQLLVLAVEVLTGLDAKLSSELEKADAEFMKSL